MIKFAKRGISLILRFLPELVVNLLFFSRNSYDPV